MQDFGKMNSALVRYLVDSGKLKTPKIIEAFENVPRHLFVTQEHVEEAYLDEPLPLIEGTTIPQPSVMASMLEALEPKEGDKVLEIGTGSGWGTALISYCIGSRGLVISIEGNMFVASFAKKNIQKIKSAENIEIFIADGSGGYERRSPYDKIIYGMAMPRIPMNVLSQLKVNGVLVAPVGGKDLQKIKKIVRVKENKYDEKDFDEVVFSPAYGKFGFHEF
ncbi:MAG: protein-L-isoaspartate O-methyltransferase family protein [Candidatus Micrarchaeia archaeon]